MVEVMHALSFDTFHVCGHDRGEHGIVGRMFHPIEDWQAKCNGPVTGKPLPCGYFIAEQAPESLLPEMEAFFA